MKTSVYCVEIAEWRAKFEAVFVFKREQGFSRLISQRLIQKEGVVKIVDGS